MSPVRQGNRSFLARGARVLLVMGAALFAVVAVRCLWFGLTRDLEEARDLSSMGQAAAVEAVSVPVHSLYSNRVSQEGKGGTGIRLKVMSYNLNHASRGNDNSPQNIPYFHGGCPEWKKICISLFSLWKDPGRLERNLERIASQIIAEDPDIIFLQEADRDMPESFGVDTARWIARKTGYRWGVWGSKWSLDLGIKYVTGSAILSKYPIVEAENIPLNPIDGKFYYRRFLGVHAALTAIVEVGSVRVKLINTHLYSKKYGYEKKKEQVENLLDLVESSPYPLIVGGDFNASFARLHSNKPASKDPTLPMLLGSGLVSTQGFFDQQTLDYLLLRPGDPTWYLRMSKLPTGTTDHSIIVSEIGVGLPGHGKPDRWETRLSYRPPLAVNRGFRKGTGP